MILIKKKGEKMEKANDFVKLAGTIGGIFLVVVVMVLVLAREALVYVFTSAVWAFVVLGIVLGAFMSKANKKK